MAVLNVADASVVEGYLSIPSSGRSVAEVRLDTAAADAPFQPGEPVTLTWEDDSMDVMTCDRAGSDRGLWRMLLVGGQGGLSKSVRPKFYAGISANAVVSDLLSEAGETSGTLTLPGALHQYIRLGALAHETLDTLMTLFPAYLWRIGRDGALSVVQASYPVDSRDLVVVTPRPAEKAFELKIDPGIQPLTTLPELGQVDRVRHTLGRDRMTEVYLI